MANRSICDVSRTFPGGRGHTATHALSATSPEVADNDVITILGPSGCGKGTLLRIVAGLDVASSGQALLDGAPVTGPGADRGMIFQSYTLFPWPTVRENICFGLRERGVPAARQAEIAGHFIAQVGLLNIWEEHRKTVLSVTHDFDEAIFMANRVVVMSARPGRIKHEEAIAFPHPRDGRIKTTPEFVRHKARLTDEIRIETQRAAMAG
jgi:NitT/TauT family transport system ATP-binding protein/sulfonate transport system ATP-binding protein